MCVKLWVFHGTDKNGYKGIGHGDTRQGGRVKQLLMMQSRGRDLGLGKGIYGSTYYNKARAYGEYVYLCCFEVSQLKVAIT